MNVLILVLSIPFIVHSVIKLDIPCFIFLVRYLHQAIDPDAPPLVSQPKPSSPYKTVGCVFNHHTFLANCQPTDAVELCSFDFQVRGWCPFSTLMGQLGWNPSRYLNWKYCKNNLPFGSSNCGFSAIKSV